MKHGFAKLGIGVSAELADALVPLPGTHRSTSFRVEDLTSFLARHGASGRDLDKITSIGHRPVEAHRNDSIMGMPTRLGNAPHIIDNSSGATKKGGESTTRESCRNKRKGASRNKRERQPSQIAGCSKGGHSLTPIGGNNALSPAGSSPLGLATSLNSRAGTKAQREGAVRTHRWDELPFWARKSSRGALRELVDHHTQ